MDRLQGIKTQKRKDLYVPFGSYYIQKERLMTENKLVLKYPSGAPIHNLPILCISENLKLLISKLLEDQKLDYNLFQKLSPHDKDYFQNIVQRAKLDNQLGISGLNDDKYQEQLKRFELLKGEIFAGNNNMEIIKELKSLIVNFINSGKMRKSEGTQILYELDSLIIR